MQLHVMANIARAKDYQYNIDRLHISVLTLLYNS